MTHPTQTKAVNVRDKVVKTIAKLDRKAAKRIFHSRQSSGHMNSQPQLKQNSFPCIFIKNSQVPSTSPFPKKGAIGDKSKFKDTWVKFSQDQSHSRHRRTHNLGERSATHQQSFGAKAAMSHQSHTISPCHENLTVSL